MQYTEGQKRKWRRKLAVQKAKSTQEEHRKFFVYYNQSQNNQNDIKHQSIVEQEVRAKSAEPDLSSYYGDSWAQGSQFCSWDSYGYSSVQGENFASSASSSKPDFPKGKVSLRPNPDVVVKPRVSLLPKLSHPPGLSPACTKPQPSEIKWGSRLDQVLEKEEPKKKVAKQNISTEPSSNSLKDPRKVFRTTPKKVGSAKKRSAADSKAAQDKRIRKTLQEKIDAPLESD